MGYTPSYNGERAQPWRLPLRSTTVVHKVGKRVNRACWDTLSDSHERLEVLVIGVPSLEMNTDSSQTEKGGLFALEPLIWLRSLLSIHLRPLPTLPHTCRQTSKDLNGTAKICQWGNCLNFVALLQRRIVNMLFACSGRIPWRLFLSLKRHILKWPLYIFKF